MTTSATTQLIPRNVLFGNPEKTSPQVSPDGTKMAYLAPINNVLNVWVGTIGSDNYQPVSKDEDRGVRFYFWAQDNKHIMYIQDVGGNENWRLYATSLETRETRDLTPFENVQVQIIDRDKHFPNELLIGMNKENPQVHDVYHLDLTTGELTLVAKNPGNIMNWVTDAHFKVRGAVTALPDGGTELLVRDDEHSEWRKLVTWDADDSLTSGPIDFTLDGQSISLQDSRNANVGRLVKLNIPTGDITVIAEDPQYDVGNVIVHPDTHEVQAVAFNKDRNEWVVLDESIKMDFVNIGGIHREDFFIISRDNTDTTWVVAKFRVNVTDFFEENMQMVVMFGRFYKKVWPRYGKVPHMAGDLASAMCGTLLMLILFMSQTADLEGGPIVRMILTGMFRMFAHSAVKHSHHEAHDVLFLPLIWGNRQGNSACWRNFIGYVLKASPEAFSAHLRRVLLRLDGKAHPLRRKPCHAHSQENVLRKDSLLVLDTVF